MSAILRGPYTIAPDAIWTDTAVTWPVVVIARDTDPAQLGPDGLIIALDEGKAEFREPVTQLHLCCAKCEQSVLCLAPGTGESYRVMAADMLASILAHLRRSHEHATEEARVVAS